ncbi:MAG: transporter substrate-binding domain-containing protein [Deltaproteobacteria bacterium]|nr:transporter substrate-binding domain-containing protein [Deltaproteobacteria bacterium]
MKQFLYVILILWVVQINATEIKIYTNDSIPTNYKENGKLIGTTVDIVEEIQKYLKKDVKIEVYPWARAYALSKKEPNIVIFTAAKTQERLDYGFQYLGPVITRKHTLYMKRGDGFTINTLEDIKNQKLYAGCLLGDWRSKFLKNRVFLHKMLEHINKTS